MSLIIRLLPARKLARAVGRAILRDLPSPLSARMQACTESISRISPPRTPTASVPPLGPSPSRQPLVSRLSSEGLDTSRASPCIGAPGALLPPTHVPS